MNDELIQYYIVNKELEMSAGKVAAQVGHVATEIAVHLHDDSTFEEWFNNNQKKIILKGKEKDLLKLIEQGFYYIRDNGLTEIPANSLTVVGLPPMKRSEAQLYIKRLQLYK
ncbi:aminoacyl-tRNA hydrolase [Priestia megaterium]